MKIFSQVDKNDTATGTSTESSVDSSANQAHSEENRTKTSETNPQEIQEIAENLENASEENVSETESNSDEEADSDPISILEAKLTEYEDIIKRQQAEFDNYRKRTLEEKQQLLTYAPGDFIKTLLPVLNNYTQALLQHENEEDPKIKSFLEGFTILKQQIDELLTASFVKPSTQVGDVFNPELHQAIMMEAGEGKEDTISEVFEQGYLFHERVLKVAHVKVLQKKKLSKEDSEAKTPENSTETSKNPKNTEEINTSNQS